MKILIGGNSIDFADRLHEAKEELEIGGHEVSVADSIDDYVAMLSRRAEHSIVERFSKELAPCDAFLICNYDQQGVKGYIGIGNIMKLNLAHLQGKRIYLLQDIEPSNEFALEVYTTRPEILGGDFSKINQN